MGIDDPQDFEGGLQRERRRLADSEAVHPEDEPVIKQWLKERDGAVKTSSLKTYLRRIRVASERSQIPLIELEPENFHDLVFTLRHDHGLSDSTIKSYENCVLPFLERMVDAEWAADIERTRVERSGPDPDSILTPGDIQDLTSSARHQRDVAFVEFLADTGARLSLTLSLRVQDVDLDEPATYTPNPNAAGLKGATITDYPLIDSASPLRSYLRTSHPRPDNPDAALFHKIKPHSRNGDERWSDDGAIRPNAIRQQLVRIADRAGVEKSVKPHAFRHMAITRMVREGYSRSQIEHRVHWTLDTDMWNTYEHITADQHTEDIFREAGLIEGEDSPDTVRKSCGNCNQPLAPHHEFCPNCGKPATADAEETVDETEGTILDQLVEATNPQTRRELQALLEELDENPDLAHDDSS